MLKSFATPILSLRGYEVIDNIKEELEKKCSNVVSCVDVLAMASKIKYSLSFSSLKSLNFSYFTNNCVL